MSDVNEFPVDYWARQRLAYQHKRAELIKKRDRLDQRIDALTYAIDHVYSDEAHERSKKFWQELGMPR
jgi:hypothetical protein